MINWASSLARFLCYRREHLSGTQPIRSQLNVVGRAWDQKGAFLMHLDVLLDGFRFLTFSFFFATVFLLYGLPLHLIRELYLATSSFVQKIRDLIAYHRAVQLLDARFPSLSAEQIATLPETTCIVCREEMTSTAEAVKMLTCRHAFHSRCLRSWFERQQACPTCRAPFSLENRPRRRSNQGANPEDIIVDDPFEYPGNMQPSSSTAVAAAANSSETESLRASMRQLQTRIDELQEQLSMNSSAVISRAPSISPPDSTPPLSLDADDERDDGGGDPRAAIRRRYASQSSNSELFQ